MVLTPQQSLILALLSARFGLRYEEIARGLYGGKVPMGAKNTIAVQIHNLRKVLEPYGIEIVTYERLGVGERIFRYAIPLRSRVTRRPALVLRHVTEVSAPQPRA
jgi:hypothetical protein